MSSVKYTPSDLKRFWSKVDTSGGMFACWLWTDFLYDLGYGCLRISGKNIKAHRISWELAYNEIPDGMLVCHKCDNPSCVNPTHLFLGTIQNNLQDMRDKGRAVHTSGERNRHAILTDDKVRAIRNRYAEGDITQAQLAADYGVAKQQVSRIIRRVMWRHV